MSFPPFPLPEQPPPIVRRGALPAVPEGDAQPDVSVVIVHRRTPRELGLCLDGLARAREGAPVNTVRRGPERERVAAQVILVDQGGAEAALAEARRRYPWLEVLRDCSDRGYAASNNLGLARATGRYLMLLNADVVLPPDGLAALVGWLDAHPQAGYAGPRLVLPSGALDPACRRSFPTPLVSLYRLAGLARLWPRSRVFGRYNLAYLPEDRPARVEAVVGACMLVRREAAEAVGLLDETYFMYGEDLDWNLRMRAAGWEGWYVPDVIAVHYKRSASARRRLRTTVEFYRAMLIFYRRHYAASAPAPVTLLVLTGILGRGLAALALAWLGERRSSTRGAAEEKDGVERCAVGGT